MSLYRYTWTKDGKQYSLGQVNIAASAINGSFSIISASPSDQGYYQCTASNGHGSAISDVGHLVMAAFDRGQQEPQQSRTVQEGQPLVLRCAPPRMSVPNATYRWTQTSERADHLQVPLDLSERLAMDTSTGGRGYSLIDSLIDWMLVWILIFLLLLAICHSTDRVCR